MRALEDPQGVAVSVYDGIRRDWRWDGTDDRSLCLARPVQDLELSPAPVVDQLPADEDTCLRACDVLQLPALAGSDGAREGLSAYVRQGEHWAGALESISASRPPKWWEDLRDVARDRIGGEAEFPWRCGPWTRFGTEVQSRPFVPRPSPAGLSTDELLTLLADDRTEDDTKFDALRGLNGREPVAELIPLLPSLGTSDGRRP
ncbi:hypothetical protein [Streptomyces sp. NPDC058335]|uniref:hypothetical protein n=1 Tax=Streptomyces sp. NPDC058335 TaxID=3346451 RepID=UPI0036543C43